MIKEDYDGLRTANVSKGGADFSLITTVAAKNEKWSSLPLFLFVTDLLLYSYFWPPSKGNVQLEKSADRIVQCRTSKALADRVTQ